MGEGHIFKGMWLKIDFVGEGHIFKEMWLKTDFVGEGHIFKGMWIKIDFVGEGHIFKGNDLRVALKENWMKEASQAMSVGMDWKVYPQQFLTWFLILVVKMLC